MKAQVFGVLASVVFLFLFAFMFRSESPARGAPMIKYIPVPLDCPKAKQPKTAPDINEKFRLVPANFINLDFKNRSFGPARLASGKFIELTLTHSDYEYNVDGDQGWFHLRDIFFADVTGDNYPEAIVWLWHVQCRASCDGGSSLFYVYTIGEHGLERIWEYETGSYAYSCGLKTITVMNKQIAVQMFGRCGQNASEVYGAPIFRVADRTILNFRFNGERFVKSETQFIVSPPTDLEKYEPQIYIVE